MKHTLLGIASCVMLAIAAPWLAFVALVAYSMLELQLGLAPPQARVGMWPLVLMAKAIMVVVFVVCVIGLGLGVFGLTSVDKNRTTACIGIVIHALTLVGIVGLISWF